MSSSTFLARSVLASVAVVIGGCRVSDVQDPAAPPTLAAGSASFAAKPNHDKTDVCHRTDAAFILISVAAPAVQAHLAHGDGLIGDPYPGQPGMRFGADCQPEIIPFDVTLKWSARGVILDSDHNGTGDQISLNNPLLQLFNGPGMEQRGVLEFHIAQFAQPVGHAELTLVLEGGSAQPFPAHLQILAYAGDGAATLSDFAAGSLPATSFDCVKPGFGQANGISSFECLPGTQITRDVTAALNSLIAMHATYAGFNFQTSGGPPAQITLDAFDNPALPTISLHVRSP